MRFYSYRNSTIAERIRSASVHLTVMLAAMRLCVPVAAAPRSEAKSLDTFLTMPRATARSTPLTTGVSSLAQ